MPSSGTSVLHSALCDIRTDEKRLAMLTYLLEQGTDFNVRDRAGYAPMHFAKNAQEVTLLMKYKADINARNREGQTPLLRAAEFGSDSRTPDIDPSVTL
jgi:ankyrin repeat protein